MDQKTLRRLEFYKVLDLLDSCAVSNQGKELVQALFPSTDYQQVFESLQDTTEAKDLLRLEPGFSLGGFKDLREILKRVKIGALLEPSDFLRVYSTLYAARRVKGFILNRKGDYPRIKAIIQEIAAFPELEATINKSISEAGEVADTASGELASIRKQIISKQHRIKEKLEHVIRSTQYQKMLQDPIVTIRGDRYVVPVKQEYRVQFSGVVHDQSASGATLFIEPMAAVELNNDLRKLRINEKVEVDRILNYLTSLVYGSLDVIEQNSTLLAKIDFIFAKARLSQKMNAGEAKLNKTFNVDIKQGRHPLIQGEVVPTNVSLGKQFDTLLITGPNTGGKTVTLKTVGLFALMNQAGLHIPSEYGTEMPIINQIFSDIGDEQSIEQSLSTFSSHMVNIIGIIKNAHRDDLVLMDEVGAGTDPTEGAALAMSILGELHQRGVKTIATTHYSELKNFAYSNERMENASVEFNVETLQPTYKLMIGQPGRSNAFEIATKLGLNTMLVEKARELISNEEIKVADLLENLEDKQRLAERDREDAQNLKNEIQALKEEYLQKHENLEEKRLIMLEQAKEEAYQILKSSRNEAESIIKELKKTFAEESEKAKSKAIEEAKQKLRTALGKVELNLNHGKSVIQRKVPKQVVSGEAVFVPKLNQKGHVVDINPSGDVVVQVGIMKITVKLKELQIISEGKKEEGQVAYSKISTNKAQQIQNEIDLRGLTVDEAMAEVEKFLDDAYLAGMPQVHIIHGKGTGALRSAMQTNLKRNKLIKSYRLGQYGEGGTGVTVVELK